MLGQKRAQLENPECCDCVSGVHFDCCLTFDMSSGPKGARRPLKRLSDGGIGHISGLTPFEIVALSLHECGHSANPYLREDEADIRYDKTDGKSRP
jgi:hypothetical protein